VHLVSGPVGSARERPTPRRWPPAGAGPTATGAARVDPAGIHDQDLLETQVQSPAVGEVVDVDVDEPFGRPSSHVGEADQVGIVAEADTADVAD